jgi:hypothetical protein
MGWGLDFLVRVWYLARRNPPLRHNDHTCERSRAAAAQAWRAEPAQGSNLGAVLETAPGCYGRKQESVGPTVMPQMLHISPVSTKFV